MSIYDTNSLYCLCWQFNNSDRESQAYHCQLCLRTLSQQKKPGCKYPDRFVEPSENFSFKNPPASPEAPVADEDDDKEPEPGNHRHKKEE